MRAPRLVRFCGSTAAAARASPIVALGFTGSVQLMRDTTQAIFYAPSFWLAMGALLTGALFGGGEP